MLSLRVLGAEKADETLHPVSCHRRLCLLRDPFTPLGRLREPVLDDSGRGPIDSLVQTRAVVEEALRLYPPIIAITRIAVRRTELVGRTIERGTMVIIAP